MHHTCTKDQLVEQPAIGLFSKLGWTTLPVLQVFCRTRDFLLPRLLSDQVNLVCR